MPRRLLALLVGAGRAPIGGAPARAAPTDVKLRVEGSNATLLARAIGRTDARTVDEDGLARHDYAGDERCRGVLRVG
jgi:hypothetical protein